jgi:hypothetical protein
MGEEAAHEDLTGLLALPNSICGEFLVDFEMFSFVLAEPMSGSHVRFRELHLIQL